MMSVLRALLVAALVAAPVCTAAQTQEQRLVLPSPIMVVDFERVFGETLYGQRIALELTAVRERVQAENDRLAQELLAEESALTEARATMEPEAFRTAAEAFNERAQQIRASREEEQTRLVNMRDTERAQFVDRIQPLIAQMMLERGAVVTMDRRSVIHAIGSANATEDVIARIDRDLGDGQRTPDERPAQRPPLETGDDPLTIPTDPADAPVLPGTD